MQSGEAQQFAVGEAFHGVGTESLGREFVTDTAHQGLGFRIRQRCGEKLHNPLIGVYGGESRLVFLPPCT